MPILPLPQFEADLAEQQAKDKEVYDRLEVPKTLVVRFGFMKLTGEFPFDSQAKPGCGSKIVVKTHRGTEMGEMLTSTCPNSGCSKSVSRNEMLTYIERSGGKDYPFFTSGRALRVATGEDMDAQAKIEQSKHKMKLRARTIAARHLPDARIVEIEPLLGGERIIVHYTSEDRLDTRAMGDELAEAFGNRVDVHHVGARDEARLTADYEKCGQYCCCKNFLKVLKPVSMRSAKVQKATLDPMKISGRCGRLMCCLRYEDATYTDLKKNLPHRKTRVGTPHGDGMVVDTQILTQLALVLLDDGERVAVPIEELAEPVLAKAPPLEERMKAGSRDKPR
ncbi:MAG: regulatory iron-sulfur-containing complex subunit RicT, partial [Planctomycetota bacterium]